MQISPWYDPALGRFAQADSIIPEAVQGVQAWDRYAYVNNSPVNFNDPSGHWGISFNLSNVVNSVLNCFGLNSNTVVNGLNTWSTTFDGVGLAIDTVIAAGDIIAGVSGALTGGFTSIPEGGAPSVVTVPTGAGVFVGAFELNPLTNGAKILGNGLATFSTVFTAASDVISGETNVVGSFSISDGGIDFSYHASIGRDTLTSGVTCALGWVSPIGLISAPIAAIPFANDLGFLYSGIYSYIPPTIPLLDIDTEMD